MLGVSVEARTGSEEWERVPTEEQRGELLASGTASFQVSWASPLAGHRYGTMFQLASPGKLRPPDRSKVVDAVVAKCRDSVEHGEQIRAKLDLCLRTATQVGLELEHEHEKTLGEHAVAIGFLWQSVERQLRPCFGHFPPDFWVETFQAGQGIAGHAFRFDRPAAWHREVRGDFANVIKMPPRNKSCDWDWILAIPILAGRRGASVGVISFSATRNETRTAHMLAEFARQIASMAWFKARRMRREELAFQTFWWLANLAFWRGLREVAGSTGLSPGVQRMARACERTFQL
jgi:hypothetical protein